MLYIKKGKEPNSLTKYKKEVGAYYDGCNKDDIRVSLLKEQGGICAYCMRRISNHEGKMSIEHYTSQSETDESEKLNYKNMLGVCFGGRKKGRRLEFLTCDAHRGNTPLTVNPLDNTTIDLIAYKSDGTIYSNDTQIDYDLNITLNLNCDIDFLRLNRRKALEAVKSKLNKIQKTGDWTEPRLLEIKKAYERFNGDGCYAEYAGVIIYYINKRLKSYRG